MTKEQKQYLKERKQKIKNQNREFRSKVDDLFKKRFIYSNNYEESVVLEDGKAHVNVDLTKTDTPFSVFSYEKRLDPEIYDFIDNEIYYLRASIPVVINFDDGGKYNDELKEKIRSTVIRHYSLVYEDKRIEHRKNLFAGVLCFIIGVLVLLLYILLTQFVFNRDNVYIEVICIVSWVFIWTATDKLFISGHDQRTEIYNAGQLALAEVTFGSPVSKKRN